MLPILTYFEREKGFFPGRDLKKISHENTKFGVKTRLKIRFEYFDQRRNPYLKCMNTSGEKAVKLTGFQYCTLYKCLGRNAA